MNTTGKTVMTAGRPAKCRRIVAMACAAMGSVAFAGTHVWTNATTANPKFTDAANWQAGTAPDVTSKAANDPHYYDGETVDFSTVTLAEGAKPQTIVLPHGSGYLLFGTLLSSPYQILNVDYSQNGMTKAAMDVIWLNNGSGFQGLISCNPAGGSGAHNQQTLIGLFNGTTLPLADARHGMGYYTHYSNASTIGQFAGAGVVTLGSAGYVGQGTTTVTYPSGPETSFYDRCGVYVLNGYTTAAALVSGAILHFDASNSSSLDVSDGKVTAWRDTSGNGIVATTFPQMTLAAPCENPGTYAPAGATRTTDASSGLPVVSFGAPYGNRTAFQGIASLRSADLGQPAALQLSSAVSGVKEVFFVFRDAVCREYQRNLTAPFVLGTASGHAALNPFGRLVSTSHFTDALFATTGAAAMMKTSAVFCDGQRIIPEETCSFDDYSRSLHVVSCGLSDGSGTIEALGLGCDTTGNVFYGGVAIAEVIAYNRTLTAEERHQVNAYLRAKWQPDAGTGWDYGSLWLTTVGNYTGYFQVGAGTTAIRDLRPLAQTFDKEGSGTLVVGRLHGFDDYVINVKGGDVRFEPPALPVEERAADPLVWFDATQVATDKILHSNNVDYVTELVDPRAGGKNHHGMMVKAVRHSRITNQTGVLGAYATLRADALNGKPVFDFGDYYAQNACNGWGWSATGSSAAPYMITLDGGLYADNMREGFAVVRIRPNSDSAVMDVFGGGGYEIFGGGTKTLLSASYTSSMARSGLWRVNGEVVDPLACARNTSDFYLVSVSLPRPLTCTTLAIDRNAYTCGGMDVAELIVYDRQLTDAERVNTEAYLMKKWFDRDHPYAKPVKVRVNAQTAPERLVQDGKGALALSGVNVDKLAGVEVNGGSLTWNFSGEDLFLGAKVHLDATAAGSLVTTGGTWVTTWSDVRGNGVAALADMGTSATEANVTVIRPGVSPTLTTATIGGVARNVIDFGDFSDNRFVNAADSNMRTNANGAAATSSAMRINIGATEADKGAEFYVVHADAHSLTSGRNGVMGIQENGSSYTTPDGKQTLTNPYPFLRNGKQLLWSGFTYAVARGGIYVDGTAASASYTIANDDEFHLYTFYPEVPVLARGLAMRTSYERGGQKLGEVAVFTNANTTVVRDRINAYLLKKWFGKGTGPSMALDEVALTDGGVFDFAPAEATPLSVKAIAGDGTVKAADISVTEALTFRGLADARGRGTGVTSLTVDGKLTLPAQGTVTIVLPANLKSIEGTFTLVTASELAGGISGLTLVCDTSACKCGTPKLALQGNAVTVTFPPQGMVLIVR